MEIQVARLRDVLGILKPAVNRKPTLDILTNVLVKDGQIMATDLDSMVIINVPEADESFLLPYADVLKMIQYVPGHEYLKMQVKRGKLQLSWSDGEATYPSKSVEEFPSVPEFEVKVEADIDGDSLIPALMAVLPYHSTDAQREMLRGVTLVLGEPIELAAGDGFRLAHMVLPLQFPEEHVVVLPAGSVSTIKHVFDKTPRTPPRADSIIPIVMAKRQIKVALDGKTGLRVVFGPTVSVIVKLVQGDPPAWLKLIPKEEPVLKAQLFARELETAVRRVSSVAYQGSEIVRLQFSDGKVNVSAKAGNQEVSADIQALDIIGAPNRLALNVGYLNGYLKDKEGIILMSWTGDTAPVSFQHGKSPKVLIMPMTVQWGDEPPAAKAEPKAEPEAAKEPGESPPAEVAPAAKTSKPRKKPSKKAKK